MKVLIAGILCAATPWLSFGASHPKSTLVPMPAPTPVTVGSNGNEPLITAAPDGTLYISALQHIYSSTNSGAAWTELAGPIYASSINLNSDSSISVDPGNRLYFTFDYPYAGTTAVCTSDDRGITWTCNPAVVPGGTDRMWTLAPTLTDAYEVTNEGLYETAFLHSTDRGLTWTPTSLGSGLLEPQSGPLLQKPGSSDVLQVIKTSGGLQLYVYHPGATGSIISDIRSTGLPNPLALPSASFGRDGQLWVASEELNPAGGSEVVLARSTDEGVTWSNLAPIPGTTSGTAIFSWVAAGGPHHVGVIYYYTPDNGDPGALTNSTWSAMWAESFNADSPVPTWTVRTVESAIHTGAICVAATCSGDNRFAGDFISSVIDANDVAHLTWMKEDMSTQATSIHYERIKSILVGAVSRKTQGATTFDIDLLPPAPGIECRSGGANGSFQAVVSFAVPITLTSVQVSSGAGSVSAALASGSQVFINLTGVTNAQRIALTLTVNDGTSAHTFVVPMGVLLGDVNASGRVDGSDVSLVRQQNFQPLTQDPPTFREDINTSGRIDGTDVSIARQQNFTVLP